MSELRIVRGNTFWTRTTVTAKDYEGTVIDDFDLSQSTDVVVIIRTAYRNIVMTEWSITENDLEIKWKDIPTGRYGLDVSGIYDGVEWRFYTENVLDIVNSNAQANIPADTIIKDDFYAIDGVTMMVTQIGGGGGNVQSDWEEEDSANAAYIKNKPTIPSIEGLITQEAADARYAQLSDIPTKVSQLQNDALYIDGSVINDYISDYLREQGEQVNVSWFTNDAGYLTQHQDISGKADKVAVVDHGTSDTTFALTANVFHKWGVVSSLTLTLASGTAGYLSEYMFEFQSGSTATSLSLPSTVTYVDTPTIEANKTYQVSIVDNIAIIVGV